MFWGFFFSAPFSNNMTLRFDEKKTTKKNCESRRWQRPANCVNSPQSHLFGRHFRIIRHHRGGGWWAGGGAFKKKPTNGRLWCTVCSGDRSHGAAPTSGGCNEGVGTAEGAQVPFLFCQSKYCNILLLYYFFILEFCQRTVMVTVSTRPPSASNIWFTSCCVKRFTVCNFFEFCFRFL